MVLSRSLNWDLRSKPTTSWNFPTQDRNKNTHTVDEGNFLEFGSKKATARFNQRSHCSELKQPVQ